MSPIKRTEAHHGSALSKLKKTGAKFEAGENFGAVVTFPTAAAAKTFLQEISKDDQDYLETGLITKINEKQLYFTLEFAAVLYAYPGESFDNIRLQELNEYTGYFTKQPLKTSKPKEATKTKSTANHSPSVQASPKAKPTQLLPKTVTEKDETPFRRENFVYNYYNEEECSLFLGEKLTDEDKRLLALLENGCSYRTLALYLIKLTSKIQSLFKA
ncbi:hypothetical protein [Legionella tunisiensis]|uniref:hypothetical protein n=1 Tax=Legionella tunisiensis TaxID=1034944 RepID=UPI0002E22EF3|nr:hypothetical protein [Legionella tunisiensis]